MQIKCAQFSYLLFSPHTHCAKSRDEKLALLHRRRLHVLMLLRGDVDKVKRYVCMQLQTKNNTNFFFFLSKRFYL